MKAVIDAMTTKYGIGTGTAGFSILLIYGDKIILSTNFGVRDNAGKPITSESNFRLASITKQFTAVAILQLIEKDKLALNTMLSDVFYDFPTYGKSITIQHLLTHTSGIRDYEDQLALIDTAQISDDQVLWIAQKQSDTLFSPGSRYQYSNGGYCVLALIVSRISGLTFDSYLQENIFSAASMPTACLNSSENIPNRVYGFSYLPDKGWFVNDQNKTSATQGDGGIYASTKELCLWQQKLYKDKMVISPKYVDLMTQPYVVTDDPQKSYGFGIYITNIDGQRCYQHGGDSIGFRNALFYLPEQDVSFALLSNLNGVDMVEMGTEILESSIKEIA